LATDKDIQLINTRFGEDTDLEIEEFVFAQLEWLIDSHKDLHTNRLPKMRKLYDGTPATETKSFPWPNSSNVVVQVIGETVDTTVAWVLGVHYATHPLWVFQNYAKPKPGDEEILEKQRQVLEDFMDLMGYEPTELDLFRKEGIWYTDACKLGTSFVKLNYEHRVEAIVTGYTSARGKRKGIEGNDETLYSGPQVDNLRNEDILAIPDAPTLQKSGFVAQKRTLRKPELEERAYLGHYDKAAVAELLIHPDRPQVTAEKQQELQEQGIQMRGGSDATAEWDIYECYFPWWHNGRKFRLILSYHKATRKVLRSVFSFLPQNELPIVRARLGYRNGGMYGKGFAELLEWYQEEVSTIHNQRNDNATAANTRMLRVSPRARNLDSNFEVYPFALLIGEKDDIETMPIADVYQSSFQNEEMALRHVQSRAGVAPAIAGAGQGAMQKRPNVYSAMGTLASMQEGTTRTNLEVTDFRHAHVTLGSLLARTFAKFGVGDRSEVFGLDAAHLEAALEAVRTNHMRIPIRAATASLNKEVEKQSDMLMVGLMQRHYTAIGQLMQAISNPIVPPQVSDYLVKVIQSSDRLMKRILKDFGYDQPDQFIPEPQLPRSQNGQQGQPEAANNPQAGGSQPVQGAAASAAGGGAGLLPQPGGGSTPGGSVGVAAPGVGRVNV
jgi:hypothetical protein